MSNTICTLPWTSVYVDNNNISPCCRAHGVESSSINSYWNSSEIKQLRVDMLAGIKNKQCEFCYLTEEAGHISPRNNNANVDIRDALLNTDTTGYYSLVKLQHAEVRFSNICNFKCRTCYLQSSSLIAAEDGIDNPVKYALNSQTKLIDEIKSQKDSLLSLRFSGGEPLMHQQHWDLLEWLIQEGKTNILLKYNTNGSLLTYRNKSIFDLWDKFDQVVVTVSIDAAGEKAEYWRSGTIWQKIITNLLEVSKHRITMEFHITVSWVNAIAMVELYKDVKLLDINFTNGSISPVWGTFSLQAAPIFKKQQIEKAFNELAVLKPITANTLYSLTQYMYSDDLPDQLIVGIQELKRVDGIRGESFLDVFPEHLDMIEYFKTEGNNE